MGLPVEPGVDMALWFNRGTGLKLEIQCFFRAVSQVLFDVDKMVIIVIADHGKF